MVMLRARYTHARLFAAATITTQAREEVEDKWEAGTETRVNSWRDFGKKDKKKKKKKEKQGWKAGAMKMPKLKPQGRPN